MWSILILFIISAFQNSYSIHLPAKGFKSEIFNFEILWITYLSVYYSNFCKMITLRFSFLSFSRTFIYYCIISIMIHKSVISYISPYINCFLFIFKTSPISASSSFWDVISDITGVLPILPTFFKIICTCSSDRLILFLFIS